VEDVKLKFCRRGNQIQVS